MEMGILINDYDEKLDIFNKTNNIFYFYSKSNNKFICTEEDLTTYNGLADFYKDNIDNLIIYNVKEKHKQVIIGNESRLVNIFNIYLNEELEAIFRLTFLL